MGLSVSPAAARSRVPLVKWRSTPGPDPFSCPKRSFAPIGPSTTIRWIVTISSSGGPESDCSTGLFGSSVCAATARGCESVTRGTGRAFALAPALTAVTLNVTVPVLPILSPPVQAAIAIAATTYETLRTAMRAVIVKVSTHVDRLSTRFIGPLGRSHRTQAGRFSTSSRTCNDHAVLPGSFVPVRSRLISVDLTSSCSRLAAALGGLAAECWRGPATAPRLARDHGGLVLSHVQRPS